MRTKYTCTQYHEEFKTKIERNGTASNLANIPFKMLPNVISSVDGYTVKFSETPSTPANPPANPFAFGVFVWTLDPSKRIDGVDLKRALKTLQTVLEIHLPSPGLGNRYMGASIAAVSICIMHL